MCSACAVAILLAEAAALPVASSDSSNTNVVLIIFTPLFTAHCSRFAGLQVWCQQRCQRERQGTALHICT
jgi:hypothetical protein